MEYHPALLKQRATIVRALAFVNHANMGSYREAIHGYLAGKGRGARRKRSTASRAASNMALV